MNFDVEFQVNPMTLDVDMGTVYDVTGDEYERGYAAGEQAGYAAGRQEGYSEGEAAGYASGQADEQAATDSIIDRTISGAYRDEQLTSIGVYGLYGCSGLTSVDFPLLASIKESGLRGCSGLTSVKLPLLTSIGVYGVRDCTGLTSVDFPLLASIGAYGFYGCTGLTSVVLRLDRVCTLSNLTSFANTPIANGTGHIYVPDDLVDSYKAATNWSTYAAQIRPLSELET